MIAVFALVIALFDLIVIAAYTTALMIVLRKINPMFNFLPQNLTEFSIDDRMGGLDIIDQPKKDT